MRWCCGQLLKGDSNSVLLWGTLLHFHPYTKFALLKYFSATKASAYAAELVSYPDGPSSTIWVQDYG